MAQPQPTSGTSKTAGQSQAIPDVLYDLATVMSNCGQAAEGLKQYIEDARKENNHDALRLFEQIRQNEIQHCDMTKEVLANFVRQGKL